MRINDHARQRMQERNFPPVLADEVMKYGKKDILHSGRTRYSFGQVVVITDIFEILTVWR